MAYFFGPPCVILKHNYSLYAGTYSCTLTHEKGAASLAIYKSPRTTVAEFGGRQCEVKERGVEGLGRDGNVRKEEAKC